MQACLSTLHFCYMYRGLALTITISQKACLVDGNIGLDRLQPSMPILIGCGWSALQTVHSLNCLSFGKLKRVCADTTDILLNFKAGAFGYELW